jgi:ATP-binding cassette subfamily B (MDR/TAP) protein 9
VLPIRSCSAPVRVVVNVVLTSTDLRDQVQQAIYNNLKGRTVLIIAHRLSTVERADRIIVISSGAVLEQGTHAELIRRGRRACMPKLVERQMLGFDVGISDEPVACDLPRSTESKRC